MIIKNRTPIAGWVFMTIWMTFLVLMTYVFIRDGGFRQFHIQWEITLLAAFWIFGLAGASFLFAIPITSLEISSDKIALTEIWILKKEIHHLQKSAIKDLYIKTTLNSDGDSYELILQTYKKDFSIQQSSDLKEIEDLKQRLEILF